MAAPRKKHEDRGHAPLAPSASKRWINCPASPAFIKSLIEAGTIKKRVGGPAAERGTRIHELGEKIIAAKLVGKKFVKPKDADQSEFDEALAYAQYCVDRWEELELLDDNAIRGIEAIAKVTEENWGSVDFWFYAAKRLTVIDLKTGRAVVPVEENTQLVDYATGLILKMSAKDYPIEEIELVIYQPNADDGMPAERSVVYDKWEFDKLYKKLMQGIDAATQWLKAEEPNYVEGLNGGDHCEYCDALGVCPKAMSRALSIATKEFKPVTIEKVSVPDPETLNADQVAEILKRAPMFEKWIEAVKGRALGLMHDGEDVEGFKAVLKMTRRKFDSSLTPGAIAKKLGLKITDITETKLLGPSAVEKLLPKEAKKKVDALTYRPEAGVVVVPVTDRRHEVESAKIVFSPITEDPDDE